MSISLASLPTINSVGLCLLRSIESENALPAGALGDFDTNWKPTSPFDPSKLQACILDAVDRLRQRLLEHISTAATRGRQYHNSLLPIHRLPPEILSTTINHALSEIENHNHQQRLIQLSSVSWRWRQATLGTPSLWGVIHSKDPDWIVSLALDRSRDAPLVIIWERGSYSRTLSGSEVYRNAIGAEEFFGLVSPHTARWCDVTLPQIGSSNTSIEWLNQHKIQLSRHLRQLNLCWNGSPSTIDPVTGFSGLAENLLELKLQNIHVSPPDIIQILSASARMTSLDLESLVVVAGGPEEVPQSETSLATIDLPCLTKLNLKLLPLRILEPIIQSINVSVLEKVSITHNMDAEDLTKPDDALAPFIARILADQRWVVLHPKSTDVTLKPFSGAKFQYRVELRGELTVILPWLRLRSLPRIANQPWLYLNLFSDDIGESPDQVVIDNLMRFPNVRYVLVAGYGESSWRWIWLLSLPDAVRTTSANAETPIKSWLWPDLKYLNISGDCITDFALLSIILARYGSGSTRNLTNQQKDMPHRLTQLLVRPRKKVWRAEVVDRIRELVGPGVFAWDTS